MYDAIIFGVLYLSIIIFKVKSMLNIIKIYLSHISTFWGEQGNQQGYTYLQLGHTSKYMGLPRSLQGLPWRNRGTTKIHLGSTCLPLSKPCTLSGYATLLHGIPKSISITPYCMSIVLQSMEEKYINYHGIPLHHQSFP